MSEINYENVKEGFAVSDIVMVIVRTSTKKYVVKTASEADFKAAIEQGSEKALKKKEQILAINKVNDVLKGYDVTFTDLLMHPEILALIEGGVATFQPSGKFESFTAPVAGSVVVRESLGIDIYCENVDTSGAAKDYIVFSLENCTGKPTEFSLKDGEFWTPKFTAESRPAKGTSPIKIKRVDALPQVS